MTLRAIRAFRLVTADPARLVKFYGALGFVAGVARAIPGDEMDMLGLAGTGSRVPLTLGESVVELDRFDQPGRPYPAGATAADGIFQHLALVTTGIADAWHRARTAGATPISEGGPITLPATSGGVTAIKFRDPDGHPLELLQFPAGATAWRGDGMLGIDHSALSVADVAASLSFYAAAGLVIGERTLNHGPPQAALDGLSGATVDVVPLAPATATPHVELLGYRTPLGRSASHRPNDIAATRIVWHADRDTLLADPDGHLHQLSR